MDETYRRDIKGIRNLQEGHHTLARKICHGKKGEIHQRYHKGMEDQLSALGLVLNCVTATGAQCSTRDSGGGRHVRAGGLRRQQGRADRSC